MNAADCLLVCRAGGELSHSLGHRRIHFPESTLLFGHVRDALLDEYAEAPGDS